MPWGLEELSPAEGDDEALSGDFKREHAGRAALTPAHSGPTAPSPPANVRAARGASPATSGHLWMDQPWETCSGHPPSVCTDCYHPLVSTLWSHSAADPRVFAHVSEAPSELGRDETRALVCLTFSSQAPRSHLFSWSFSSSLMTFLPFPQR